MPKKKKHTRVVRDGGHGYFVISLPAKLVKALGIRLNQELVLNKIDENPMLWEIRVRPAENRTCQPSQEQGKTKQGVNLKLESIES